MTQLSQESLIAWDPKGREIVVAINDKLNAGSKEVALGSKAIDIVFIDGSILILTEKELI
jgi:hypothetical protein